MPDIEDTVDSDGKLLNQQPAYYKILQSEVSLRFEYYMTVGRVIRRAIGPERYNSGSYDDNPFFNSMIYEVEFLDEQVK